MYCAASTGSSTEATGKSRADQPLNNVGLQADVIVYTCSRELFKSGIPNSGETECTLLQFIDIFIRLRVSMTLASTYSRAKGNFRKTKMSQVKKFHLLRNTPNFLNDL